MYPFQRHGVQIFRNLVYSPLSFLHFDPARHVLDVYMPYPKPESPCPVVICVHGGAWIWGERTQEKPRHIGKTLARCGYVVCVISYRLSHLARTDVCEFSAILTFVLAMILFSSQVVEKKVWMLIGILVILLFLYAELQIPTHRNMHPCHVHDVGMAMKWTYDEISRYNGDNTKIFLLGHSAGGHLVSLIAARPCEYLTIPKSSLKGIVSISGVYNAARLADSRLGVHIGRSVFGNHLENWHKAFPLDYITSDHVPVLLLNAEFEGGLKGHANDYWKVLKEKGVKVRQLCFCGLNHFNIICFWTSIHLNVLCEIDKFIMENL